MCVCYISSIMLKVYHGLQEIQLNYSCLFGLEGQEKTPPMTLSDDPSIPDTVTPLLSLVLCHKFLTDKCYFVKKLKKHYISFSTRDHLV